MNSYTNRSSKGLWFFLCPIIGFIKSLGDAHTKSSQVVIILFCGIVGWLMNPPATSGLDVSKYFTEFDNIASWSANTFGSNLQEYLTFDSMTKDFYFETVVYLCSRIIPNPHFYYLIFGLVFGIFFAKSLSIMLSCFYSKGGELNYYSGAFLFLIVFAIPFYLIESIRFWTSAWIAIYVALKVFVENKPKYMLWLLLALFIHGTYLIFIVLFVVSFFCSRTNKFTYPLVILVYLSIPFSYLSFEVIDSVSQFIPGFLERTTENYVARADESHIGTGLFWVSDFFNQAEKILDYIFIVLLTLNRKTNNDGYSKLYIFWLVIIAFANFTTGVPSLGVRYYTLCQPILYFLCLMTFQNEKYGLLMKLVPFVYSFSIVYFFYYSLPNCIGAFSLFVPPIISFFKFVLII